MRAGWYLALFERELVGDLSPIAVDGIPAMVVVGDGRVRAFEATCPHRGANLAVGGRVEAGHVICPFHGKRVLLGQSSSAPYCVEEFEALGYGGLIFVRMRGAHESHLEETLSGLAETHVFAPGFAMPVRATAQLVIQNAFDESHFRPVHGVTGAPTFRMRSRSAGDPFVVDGTLEVPTSAWQRATPTASSVEVPFVAQAFSPHLVISEMGGQNPYTVITGATPIDGRTTVVRLCLAVPRGADADTPSPELCRYLIEQSLAGLRSDALIWENMALDMTPRLAPQDAVVAAFDEFCAEFEA